MGVIMILAFHGGVLAVILMLLHYLMGEALSTDILFILGTYTGMLSVVNIAVFIPMYFLNKVYREMQLKYNLEEGHMKRAGHLVAGATVLFVTILAFHFGFDAKELENLLMGYFDWMSPLWS